MLKLEKLLKGRDYMEAYLTKENIEYFLHGEGNILTFYINTDIKNFTTIIFNTDDGSVIISLNSAGDTFAERLSSTIHGFIHHDWWVDETDEFYYFPGSNRFKDLEEMNEEEKKCES